MIFELRYNEDDDGYDLITYTKQSPFANEGIEAGYDDPAGRKVEPILRSIRQILRQELVYIRNDGFGHPDVWLDHPRRNKK